MYQIEAWAAVRGFWRARRHGRESPLSIGGNVIALGVTSLLTDISSEMVATILPVFLVVHLGLTPLHFGVVEGLYQGMTALLRVASGAAADRFGRFKAIAGAGYAMSAVSRLAMVFAGVGTWPLIVGAVAADRLGKGIRVVPRDVMISMSSPPSGLATAFGVHRAFDSAGAMLGPLVGLGILSIAPSGFDVVFMVSFCVAVCGVAALWFFVDDAALRRRAAAAVAGPGGPIAAIGALVRVPGFAVLTAVATVLGLATVSDGFLYLLLQRHAGFNPGLLPLLYVGTSFSYLVFAVPAGRLADRLGQRRGLLAGYAALLACYGATAAFGAAWLDPAPGVVLAVLLLGVYYALTDGVLMAAASALLPEAIRGSGLAWMTTLTSLSRSLAAVGFGAVWTTYGEAVALRTATVVLGIALAVSAVVLRNPADRIGTIGVRE